MDTYEVMKQIKEWHGIADPDDQHNITNAQCLRWINQARRKIQRGPRLRFSEYEEVLVASQSTRSTPLPTGWLDFESMFRLADGVREWIQWIPLKKTFDKFHPDQTIEGKPTAATQWGENVLWGPVPDDDYDIFTSGHKMVDDLTMGTGVSHTDGFLDECWECILAGALVLSSEHATVPEAKQAYFLAWYDQELTLVRTNYRTAKTGTGRIISHNLGTVSPQNDDED